MKKMQKQFNTRLKVVFTFLVLTGFVIIANLFYIQVKTGPDLRAQADDQYVVSTHNSFKRGNIYFSDRFDSRVNVAGQKKGYKISINPSKLSKEDKQEVYSRIESELILLKNITEEKILNSERRYMELAVKIPTDQAKNIKSDLGKKISLHSEKWRIYPLKNTAAHLIGFLGFDKNDEFNGRYGLENYYNDVLVRESKDLYTNFFARVFHGVQNLVESGGSKEGDIISSIDPQVQLFLEKEVWGIQEKWNSESTGAIIMDPKTGEIVAMFSAPSFDNNDFKNESLSRFKNPLVSNVYEFGSVMKPFVVAMGLDSKVINAKTEYYDKGSIDVERHTIYNFDKRGRGWVDTQEILNQSLNTGMVDITKKIKKDDFRSYFADFGFGKKSGIDLPGDTKGLSANLKSNRQIEFANMSFGQGIAMSPISFVKGLSALANAGKTVDPHVIKKIEYTSGFSDEVEPVFGEQAIDAESAGEISRMLVNVFDNYRDGDVKFDSHTVAAKTGTAQIAHPKGGYYDDRNLHSFFGYFPAYEPEFVVLLYTVHPKDVKYASQTLIDPFRSLGKYLINYYQIPPDR